LGDRRLHVPAGGIDALAAALVRLAASRELRQRLGEAGRRQAETKFSAVQMASAFAVDYVRLASLPRADLGWSSLPGGLHLRLLKR
jgi:hypothetical protein